MDGRVSRANMVILYHLKTNGPHRNQEHSKTFDRKNIKRIGIMVKWIS